MGVLINDSENPREMQSSRKLNKKSAEDIDKKIRRKTFFLRPGRDLNPGQKIRNLLGCPLPYRDRFCLLYIKCCHRLNNSPYPGEHTDTISEIMHPFRCILFLLVFVKKGGKIYSIFPNTLFQNTIGKNYPVQVGVGVAVG